MRPLILFAALFALPVQAADVALVLANGRDADRVARAADALEEAGVALVRDRDADRGDMIQALRQFEQLAGRADAAAVALVGRFVHAGDQTWFLPDRADPETLSDVVANGLPLSVILAMLEDHPSRALLMLAANDSAGGEAGGGALSDGIGPLDIPQGVTVARGTPDQARRFLSDPSRAPADAGLQVTGYAPQGWRLLSATTPAPTPARPPAPTQDNDRTLWVEVTASDSEAAYIRYLDRYPRGRFADLATQRLREIRTDPDRNARLGEEALNLNRDARRAIQRDLSLLGYDTRGVDGIFGPGTRRAVRDWQSAQGRVVTGWLDAGQIDRLDVQAATRAAELAEEERVRQTRLEREDRAYWDRTGAAGNAQGMRAYLDRYPDGLFAERAEERLSEIDRDTASTREAVLWQQARQSGDTASYQRYLQAFPKGRWAAEARRALGQDQATDAARAAEASLGLNPLTARAVEDRLQRLGHEPGKVDGQFDKSTRRALRRYQKSAGLPVTGYMDQSVVVRLLADSLRDVLSR